MEHLRHPGTLAGSAPPAYRRRTMRVLIATVSAGGGHVAAAAAIEEAWKEIRPSDRLARLDVMDFTSALSRHVHHRTYVQVIEHVPELFGLVFNKTDNPELVTRLQRFRRSFARRVNRPFVAEIQSFRPDILVCTHYLASEIAGALKARDADFRAFVACAVTDFEAHALWMEAAVDLYCVAAEETRSSLIARGVPADKLVVTGIPIARKFAKPVDAAAVRRQLGLRDDLPVLLLLGGGLGVGPMADVLGQLDRVEADFQVVAVAGRNEELRRDLAARDYRHPVRVLGFAGNMHELMTASALVVSKPGGLTTSEALALGRPLFIINPIPGQEAANSDYLLERGAAVKVNRLQDIAPRLRKLLAANQLPALSRAAAALGRPDSAPDLCRTVLAAAAAAGVGATTAAGRRGK